MCAVQCSDVIMGIHNYQDLSVAFDVFQVNVFIVPTISYLLSLAPTYCSCMFTAIFACQLTFADVATIVRCSRYEFQHTNEQPSASILFIWAVCARWLSIIPTVYKSNGNRCFCPVVPILLAVPIPWYMSFNVHVTLPGLMLWAIWGLMETDQIQFQGSNYTKTIVRE